jgi:hypothetical protein
LSNPNQEPRATKTPLPFFTILSLNISLGVKHEKKNFFGIEFNLLGNCIFKEQVREIKSPKYEEKRPISF